MASWPYTWSPRLWSYHLMWMPDMYNFFHEVFVSCEFMHIHIIIMKFLHSVVMHCGVIPWQLVTLTLWMACLSIKQVLFYKKNKAISLLSHVTICQFAILIFWKITLLWLEGEMNDGEASWNQLDLLRTRGQPNNEGWVVRSFFWPLLYLPIILDAQHTASWVWCPSAEPINPLQMKAILSNPYPRLMHQEIQREKIGISFFSCGIFSELYAAKKHPRYDSHEEVREGEHPCKWEYSQGQTARSVKTKRRSWRHFRVCCLSQWLCTPCVYVLFLNITTEPRGPLGFFARANCAWLRQFWEWYKPGTRL